MGPISKTRPLKTEQRSPPVSQRRKGVSSASPDSDSTK
uniref:Uncharacterized protein n=1 Tax=Arundo donax TaxID=35708 RepID=A0A0A8ZCH0_ARUDO